MTTKIGLFGVAVFVALIAAAFGSMAFNVNFSQPITGQITQSADKNYDELPADYAKPLSVRTVEIGYRDYAFYFPESGSDTIRLNAGEPVKLVGLLEGPDKLVGCMKSVRTPWGLKVFTPGDNTLEFTPQNAETVVFTCGMGMGAGMFEIIN